ncbi:MAG TPA: MoxR family ATPase [Phycisphaerae bacterium]|nr:MoxR family ATPase [Phycisphaerae bacterium]
MSLAEPTAPATFVPAASINALRSVLQQAILGKNEVIELTLACLLSRSHLLIEDLPGLGKTTLAKALAHAIGGRFVRLQCTPDLTPSDITGFSLFNQKTREFEFQPGPVFSDVLLADEINRTPPRTQSALLEAMGERQVSADGRRHVLPETFFVIATQNPHDQHGTYPLPEAQLDRFGVKLNIGYAAPQHELEMLQAAVGDATPTPPRATLDLPLLAALQRRVANLHVNSAVQRYLIELAHATRTHPQITLGLSPRGLLTWQRMAQAWAYLHLRDFVTPDDVQDTAEPVLSVRIAQRAEAGQNVLREILETVPVPPAGNIKHGAFQ